MKSLLITAFVILPMVHVAGCSDASDAGTVDPQKAELYRSVGDVRQALHLRMALVAALESDPVEGLEGEFLQQSCATVTSEGTTDTYVLADCDGPHGLRGVSGTLTAYRTADSIEIEATGLSVNGFSFTFDRTLQVAGVLDESGWSVTLPSGQQLMNRALAINSPMANGEGCLTTGGSALIEWQFEYLGAEHVAVITTGGGGRCWGSCPVAEETRLKQFGSDDLEALMTLVGATATWESGADTGEVQAPCGDNLDPPAPWSPN